MLFSSNRVNGEVSDTAVVSPSPVDFYTEEQTNAIVEKKKSKSTPFIPPQAKEIPVKIFDKHGIQVVDEFFWLKDKKDPKVLKYLENENAFANARMKHTQELQDDLYNEFASRCGGDDKSAYTQIDDYFYYWRMNAEDQYAIHCRRFDTLDNEEQQIFDENKEAEGEDYFYLGMFKVSPDHNFLVYGVDVEGNENFSLRFKDLSTMAWMEDEIYPVGWTVCWAADNKSILYTKIDPKGRSFSLYRHVLGENLPDGSDDVEIYREDDERFCLRISTTSNKRFFLLQIDGQVTSEVRYLSTLQPKGNFEMIAPRVHGVQYSVTNHGNYFWIRTNVDGAKNFKVMKALIEHASNPSEYPWEEVLPHREEVFVERIDLFRHHFVAWEWEGNLQKIRVEDLSDGEVHYVQLSGSLFSIFPGEIDEDEDKTDVQYFNTNTLRFTYTSFLTPRIVFDYDMDNRRKRKRHEQQVTGFIKDHYHEKRIYATSSVDGAQVPISLVYKISLKNSTGGNPLLLHAYGAYANFSMATFEHEVVSLLDRGFIYAIAHVRGDANLGADWHDQGRLTNKKNSFFDFISCCEHLIAEEYTTSEKLAIHGKSAGGMLVCAAANMRPELFNVLMSDVPFADVFGTITDAQAPWTPFDWDEWGNPLEDPEVCRYVLSYSPYHNIQAKEYPHMLITTGFNDARVSFSDAARYTAKLRKRKLDNNLLILRTHLAGHKGASGRYDQFEEIAFQFAFLIDRLGVIPTATDSKPLMKVISPVAITPQDLFSMFQGYQVTTLLCSALELGIFDELHAQQNFQSNADVISKNLGLNRDGTERILDALSAVGILSAEDGNYSLTQVAATHLVKGVPGYVGELSQALANEHLWKAMRNLTLIIKQPKSLGNNKLAERAKRTLAENSTSACRYISVTLQAALSSWSTRRKNVTILDFACGNGLIGFYLAQQRQNVKVWSLDSPEMIQIARRYADEMKLTPRVNFIESSDFFQCDVLGPYDLIIIGQDLFNTLGYSKSSTLLQNISDALKSTGRILLHETIIGVEQSPYPHLVSMSMYVQQDGKVHPLSWFKDLLGDNGFENPQVIDLHPFPEKLLISSRNIIYHSKKQKDAGSTAK